MDLISFRPENFFAFVKDLNYTVTISPSHDMQPSSRVVLTMPEHLIFNPSRGCTVSYTVGDCKLVAGTNEIILTNVFKERTPGGTVLKFVIKFGDNPIGARYAGDWGARTEGVFEGQYYTVDGAFNGYSFKALPGYIKSTLTYRGTKTFSEESFYDFTFETEHSVPVGGFLRMTLPVEMAFPKDVVDSQRPVFTIEQNSRSSDLATDKIRFNNVTTEYISFEFPSGHNYTKHNPLRLTLENIRTPRSFRPSSEFTVETRSTQGYIIDAGGSDITVVMNQMNDLTALDVHVNDLSNGAVTAYKFKIDTFVYLKDADRLLVTLPPTVGFGPNGISCRPATPDPVGITDVSCENIDEKTFYVQLARVDKQNGIFEFFVDGMKNPPNYRTSGKFSNIFMETFDFYDMQRI
jgi:hypothetical protein